MKAFVKTMREEEQGFTLVELAVVMIIIGLLIGGILRGQELITNARVTTTASQLEAMSAAYNGFRDQYNALPGDFASATTRLSNCSGTACRNGNGNGLINRNVGQAPALSNESSSFFGHLLAADLITGMDGTAVLSFGNALPSAPIGGGFTVGDARIGASGFPAAQLRPSPHLVLTGTTATVGAGTGVLTPQQAANIDRRLDDGAPNTGVVIGQGTANNCRASSTAAVYQNAVNQVCAIAYRIQ